MIVKIKKIQRHTVIYTDEYEIPKDEFIKLYKSEKGFYEQIDKDDLEDFKINTVVDDVSNKDGTYDEDWDGKFPT